MPTEDDRPSGPSQNRLDRYRPAFEVIAAIVLSAATVLTAWSAFESAKWSGLQATNFSLASATRTESIRASTLVGQQSLADVSVFTTWLSATEQGQTRLAGIIAKGFRGEFKVAFNHWEAMSPLTNPSAPASPFDLSSYQLAESGRSNQLEAQASQQFLEATKDNRRADNYVLMTVLFSIALFFGAMSGHLANARLELPFIAIEAIVFFGATAVTATFPVRI